MDGEIDPEELAALLEAAGDEEGAGGDERRTVRVVDIRDRRAFDRGHVPGSESIPFPELTTRAAELTGAERIVTVCPHGVASKQAAELIGSYAGTVDARVESLRGGIERWEREIDELDYTSTATTSSGGVDTSSSGESDTSSEEGPDAPF